MGDSGEYTTDLSSTGELNGMDDAGEYTTDLSSTGELNGDSIISSCCSIVKGDSLVTRGFIFLFFLV
jgi:hypothetical protein